MPRNIIDKLAWWISNKEKRKPFRYDINKTVIDSLINNKEEFIAKYPELYNKILNFLYENDEKYLHPDCPISEISHLDNMVKYLSGIGNKKGVRILEVGSRVVTGNCFRDFFSNAEYVGFDYYDGPNVDVVGDAHKLSSYFNKDEKFDIIFSNAVFEHLAMPWKAAQEIAKLLKVGGTVFIVTHFAFSSHERPWHFFHFTDMALKVLFSEELGFECIESGFFNSIVGRFSKFSSKYLINSPVTGLYSHCSYLGKKVKEVENFDWNSMTVEKVVKNTLYPKP